MLPLAKDDSDDSEKVELENNDSDTSEAMMVGDMQRSGINHTSWIERTTTHGIP